VDVLDWLTGLLLALGLWFLLAGTIGLLRFPDVYTRLHAMTKADNVGLGLVAVALAVQAASLLQAAKIIFIWTLVLVASTTACHLVARSALREGKAPWQRT
jgi:multicomponent Na+:H+ antiporter subunit G